MVTDIELYFFLALWQQHATFGHLRPLQPDARLSSDPMRNSRLFINYRPPLGLEQMESPSQTIQLSLHQQHRLQPTPKHSHVVLYQQEEEKNNKSGRTKSKVAPICCSLLLLLHYITTRTESGFFVCVKELAVTNE